MSIEEESNHYLQMTADIVSAFVSKNAIPSSDLSGLIVDVHAALVTASKGTATPVEVQIDQKPAVSIKKSVTPDYLICLEDGKQFKSLRRHLSATYGMTPEQYRTKWSLPSDYPMVAPSYSAARSALARDMGLGQKRKKADKAARGRKKKEQEAAAS